MNKRCHRRTWACWLASVCALGSLALMPAPIAYSAVDKPSGTQDQWLDRYNTAQQWLHTLDAVSGTWQPVQTLMWFGRPLWLRQFAMAQGLSEVAEQFTQTAPMLDRALTGPDTLLLSGMVGHLHLVVQLQRALQGVHGFASVLDTAPSIAQQVSADGANPALAWLHQDTQVHAAQWLLPDGSRVRQVAHVIAQKPDQLHARLHAALARQGWQEVPAIMGKATVQWQRRADYLHIAADRSGYGSVLYQVWME